MRTPLMAGNWKMFKTPAQTKDFFAAFLPLVAESKHCEIAICPPFVNIAAAVDAAKGSRVGVGAQNLYWKNAGAFTVAAGKSVTFRYRFYFHEGDEAQAKVAEHYKEYVWQTTSKPALKKAPAKKK